MKILIQLDGWAFELKQVHARRVENYGEPFTATALITVTDGTPHVEGLLARSKFSREDVEIIEAFMRQLGFTEYVTSHFENDQRVVETKTL